ncbi:MAG: hypothetical protein PVF54_05630 [Anaerolineae bacterium]|jgi:hypothetical protein
MILHMRKIAGALATIATGVLAAVRPSAVTVSSGSNHVPELREIVDHL